MTEMSAELVAALLNDEAKSARLAELLAQMKRNQAILDESSAARDAAEVKVEAARKAMVTAKAVEDAAAQRHAQLDESQKGLGEAITTYNSDRKSFNEIRDQIEADLKQRTAAVEAREVAVTERETALAHQELDVAEAKADVIELRADLKAKHERLAAALADHIADGADEPVVIATASVIQAEVNRRVRYRNTQDAQDRQETPPDPAPAEPATETPAEPAEAT